MEKTIKIAIIKRLQNHFANGKTDISKYGFVLSLEQLSRILASAIFNKKLINLTGDEINVIISARKMMTDAKAITLLKSGKAYAISPMVLNCGVKSAEIRFKNEKGGKYHVGGLYSNHTDMVEALRAIMTSKTIYSNEKKYVLKSRNGKPAELFILLK